MSHADSQSLAAADKAHCWHPFTPIADWEAGEALVIERGEGVYLFDIQGRRYFDGTSSLWCAALGHRHPGLDAALSAQISQLAHSTFLGMTHPAAIRLAQRLASKAPAGLRRVFYSDNGATAVEIALKMAFQYHRQKERPEPGRTRFLAIENAYHGDTLGDVSVGGVDRFHAMFRPLLFETVRAPSPYCYRCPLKLQFPGCGLACLDEAKKLIDTHADTLVAVVAEPVVQGAAGMIAQPPGWLGGLARHCRELGVLLILDEVAVGFGRTGTLFACEQEGVSPDFLCMAKGLTGGYLPLAATLTTDAIYSAFRGDAVDPKTFYHGHTFTGNPLGASVALAVLDAFEQDGVLENVVRQSRRVAERLQAALAPRRFVGEIRQRGLMCGIELVKDQLSREPLDYRLKAAWQVVQEARRRGLLVRPLGDTVTFLPPLVSNDEEIDAMLDILIHSYEHVEQELTRTLASGAE
ncbi:MAG: adenosylmethionine--8-amino-7-oxononanoate transaminase [bacterium]